MQLFRHDPTRFSDQPNYSIKSPTVVLRRTGNSYYLVDVLPSNPNRSEYIPSCVGNRYELYHSELVPYTPITFKEL